MKQSLLLSSALIILAGAAAAEVSITGEGRFGVVAANGDSDYDVNTVGEWGENLSGAEVAFSSRLRVIFGLSFESDTGLTFGGETRLDNAEDANNGTAGSVFVSGDFGMLAIGDVDSAAKAAVGDISDIGYTGVGDYNETFYLLGGGGDPLANDEFSAYALPAALYSYSTGGLTFYVGLGNPAGIEVTLEEGGILPDGRVISQDVTVEGSQQYSLGIAWENETFSVAAGYESSKFEDLTDDISERLSAYYIGGTATFGGATFKAMYGDISDLDFTQYGLSVDYTFDALTVTAYLHAEDYNDRILTDGSVAGERTAYGVGGTYDLGGGVLIKGGIADPDLPGVYYQADFGVTFEF
jgi:outer membrane protein OmpU